MKGAEMAELRKYLQKVRKLFNQISKDCNGYVDQFDTINYSLNKIDNIVAKASSKENSATKPGIKDHKPKVYRDNESSDS